MKLGYDPQKLELATAEEDEEWNDERINRLDTEDEYPDGSEDHEANKMYWLEEWYIHYDYDGDGIAEQRKVDYIGGQIFENIEYDCQPIVALSCIPMTHRHSGLSLADIMRPIQELSTYLKRGVNNNIAQVIEPKKYLSEQGISSEGDTLSQLLDATSNIVVTRVPGMIETEQYTPVIQDLMAVHQSLENEKQVRSGIAPNLSLDPEVLQQSTMGGYTAALQEASQRIELICRIFAETGVKDALLKAHRQIKEYQDKAKTIRIRGEWVETDPRDWRDRNNVTVNVGLGFNNKEKQIAMLTQLLGIQKEALGTLATPDNIYNTLEQLVEAAGLKSVDRYFTSPSEMQPQQPQPDPNMLLAQAQIQAINQDIQIKGAKAQGEEARANAKHEAEVENIEADTQAKLAKAVEAGAKAGSAQIAATNEALSQEYA